MKLVNMNTRVSQLKVSAGEAMFGCSSEKDVYDLKLSASETELFMIARIFSHAITLWISSKSIIRTNISGKDLEPDATEAVMQDVAVAVVSVGTL